MIQIGDFVIVAFEDPSYVGLPEYAYQDKVGQVQCVSQEPGIDLKVTVKFIDGEVNHFAFRELENLEDMYVL